jgi:hypothetical protein
MACIVCGGESKNKYILQGVGCLCSNECYTQFCRNREKALAQSCWGEKAEVEFGGRKYGT